MIDQLLLFLEENGYKGTFRKSMDPQIEDHTIYILPELQIQVCAITNNPTMLVVVRNKKLAFTKIKSAAHLIELLDQETCLSN